jgi:hypothetical protein
MAKACSAASGSAAAAAAPNASVLAHSLNRLEMI